MKRSLVVVVACAWMAFTVVATSCAGGDGAAPAPPFDPFGVDPAPITGQEPTGATDEAPSTGGGGSIAQLCAQACARIQASCPENSNGTSCASDCAGSNPVGCEAQFRAFLQCLIATQQICIGDQIPCEDALVQVNNCAGTNGTR